MNRKNKTKNYSDDVLPANLVYLWCCCCIYIQNLKIKINFFLFIQFTLASIARNANQTIKYVMVDQWHSDSNRLHHLRRIHHVPRAQDEPNDTHVFFTVMSKVFVLFYLIFFFSNRFEYEILNLFFICGIFRQIDPLTLVA